jgi:hypothetical protein
MALLLAATWGCEGPREESEELADFYADSRAWRSGERDSLIDFIVDGRWLDGLPFVGNLSDLAPLIYQDPDSQVAFVPNPDAQIPFNGPGDPLSRPVAPDWRFFAVKLTYIDDRFSPADSFIWHAIVWANPASYTQHGVAIVSARTDTFTVGPFDLAAFAAVDGAQGTGAIEIHRNTGAEWQDDRFSGRFSVTGQVYPGQFDTLPAGPIRGALVRAGRQYGRIQSARLRRSAGSESPRLLLMSLDWRVTGLPSVEVVCRFPVPCIAQMAP